MDANEKKECSVEEYRQQLRREFSAFDDRGINTVYWVYNYIKGAEKELGAQLLECICFAYEETAFKHEKEAVPVIMREDQTTLSELFDEIIEARFKSILARKYDEKTFYEKLWFFIWESDIFSDIDESLLLKTKDKAEEVSAEDKARAYALFEILRDKRIPYYSLPDGLTMSNEDFRQKCEDLADIKRKIRFILFSGIFEQKTEKASQLVRIIDSLSAFEEKTICLVFIIGELQKASINIGNTELLPLLSMLRDSQ